MKIQQKLQTAFSGLRISGNIYVGLFLRLGLAMILFSICRIGFYLFNMDSFPDLPLWRFSIILLAGIRFDLTAVLYTNMIFILLIIIPFQFRFRTGYQKFCQWIFYVFNAIALSANVADFIYFRFTGRRTTADVFKQFENEKNLGGLFMNFLLDYWHAVIFLAALLGFMVWCYKKVKVVGPQLQNKIVFYSSGVLALPIFILMMIGGLRGGFLHSTRPITLNDAGQYVTEPIQSSLVLNTPFTIYRTLGKTQIQKVNYFNSEEELASVFTPLHSPDSARAMNKMNVVIIILESFSQEFVGFYNGHRENGRYKGYTPFLDSLASHSKTFEHSFASGRKSIDGLPSIIASIPSLSVPYVLTPYSGNKINGLGNILKPEGYHTSFFHGAPNGSMGFSSFMNIAGIDNYFGMNDYPDKNDHDGLWGIWDEKFFGFWANLQKGFPQPFLSVIFSVSSHHPFIIPKEYEEKFKGGSDPMLKCIEYSDFALRKYFERVAKQDWYANTLFVITADHVSSQVIFKDSHSARGHFSIPILFFRPDNSLAGRDNGIISQADIMPTVLDYLGYDKEYVAFGTSARLTSGGGATRGQAWNFIDNLHHFYQHDYLLQFDGKKSVGLFDFKRDTMLSKNLIHHFPDTVSVMETKIKAIIQQYNNRMVENRLSH